MCRLNAGATLLSVSLIVSSYAQIRHRLTAAEMADLRYVKYLDAF